MEHSERLTSHQIGENYSKSDIVKVPENIAMLFSACIAQTYYMLVVIFMFYFGI